MTWTALGDLKESFTASQTQKMKFPRFKGGDPTLWLDSKGRKIFLLLPNSIQAEGQHHCHVAGGWRSRFICLD